MISVDEATDRILQHMITLPAEVVALQHSVGRVLAEDLVADRDFPPFDRITMDGIAIDYSNYQRGSRNFKIQETAAAGSPQSRLRDNTDCIEVMTGAMLPEGCDTVIRYEDLRIDHGRAEIIPDTIVRGQNIHGRATDRKAGDVIVPEGKLVSAAEIGIAATVGLSGFKVRALPRIAVISTGDEIVDIDQMPLPHQIRQSNVSQVAALIRKYGAAPQSFHLADDPADVSQKLSSILEAFDCLILSGGVSAGKFDYVPESLAALGVEKLFHHVAQRPGKPFWFGIKKDGLSTADWRLKTVFALPGNPVSSFMCTVRYVLPWLERSLGIRSLPEYALLTEHVTFHPDLTYFLQVLLEGRADGALYAIPAPGHGSGDLANLVDADAFIELPMGRAVYGAGESFRVWRWR